MRVIGYGCGKRRRFGVGRETQACLHPAKHNKAGGGGTLAGEVTRPSTTKNNHLAGIVALYLR